MSLPPGLSDQRARVVVLSRQGCHLCAEALAVVARVCGQTGADYVEVDVDADPQLQHQYTDQVPVTFVDGHQHDFWRVDETRLRTALTTPSPPNR